MIPVVLSRAIATLVTGHSGKASTCVVTLDPVKSNTTTCVVFFICLATIFPAISAPAWAARGAVPASQAPTVIAQAPVAASVLQLCTGTSANTREM